jgi:hypothetical protein
VPEFPKSSASLLLFRSPFFVTTDELILYRSGIPYFQRKKNGKGQSGRNTDDEREASAPPASAEPESQPMGLERGSSYVHDPRVGRSRRESVLGKLKGEKSDGGKTRPSFAKNQREALEDYLIGLVKAIVRCSSSSQPGLTRAPGSSELPRSVLRCSDQKPIDSYGSSRFPPLLSPLLRLEELKESLATFEFSARKSARRAIVRCSLRSHGQGRGSRDGGSSGRATLSPSMSRIRSATTSNLVSWSGREAKLMHFVSTAFRPTSSTFSLSIRTSRSRLALLLSPFSFGSRLTVCPSWFHQRPKRALRRGAHKLEHWNDKARGDTHSIADSAVEAEARLAEIEGSVHGGGDRATITSQDADAEGRKENSVRKLFLSLGPISIFSVRSMLTD